MKKYFAKPLIKNCILLISTNFFVANSNAQTAIDNDPSNDIEFYRDTLPLLAYDSIFTNTATLVSATDVDWYMLQLNKGGVLEAWCEPDSAFGLAISAFDYVIYQAHPTYYMGSGQSAVPASTPHLIIQLSAGDYRFKILKSTVVTGFGSYRLKYTLHTILDFGEGNDDESMATLIPLDTCFGARIQGIHLNDDLFLGTKCGNNASRHQDFDWYKIYVNIDTTDTMIYNVSITNSPSNQNFVIEHKKENSTLTSYNQAGYGGDESWTLQLDSGVHYFKIYERHTFFTNCQVNDGYNLSDSAYQICFDYRGLIGINEKDNQSYFAIHPNPAFSSFTITTTTQLQNAQIEIYNMLGKKVCNKQFASRLLSGGKKEITIDVSELSAGIYFVKLQSEKAYLVQKLVVR